MHQSFRDVDIEVNAIWQKDESASAALAHESNYKIFCFAEDDWKFEADNARNQSLSFQSPGGPNKDVSNTTDEELTELIDEIDEDGSGAIEFGEFAQLCAKFLVEDPDPETLRAELKDAFRLFDKEGSGFITMVQFRGIIAEVDPKLTEEDLDAIIAEIDEDGSGTMDFEEFCEMMMATDEDKG